MLAFLVGFSAGGAEAGENADFQTALSVIASRDATTIAKLRHRLAAEQGSGLAYGGPVNGWSLGMAIIGRARVPVIWLAACDTSPHDGALVVLTAKGVVLHDDDYGCIEGIIARDINGDGRNELIVTDHGEGRTLSQTRKTVLFHDDRGFAPPLRFVVTSDEWQAAVVEAGGQRFHFARHVEGRLRFFDLDADGFKETARIFEREVYEPNGFESGSPVPAWAADRLFEAAGRLPDEVLDRSTGSWTWDAARQGYVIEEE